MNHGPFTIPEISDAELKRRSCIRPVVRIDGRLRWIRKVNPRTVAFTWSPKPLKVVRGLEKLVTIETLHRYGYYGFFKPSIAEVVSQIPDDLLALVVAFETIGPDDATDLNKESKALNAGFHVARTTLYRRRSRPNAEAAR